MLQVEFDEESWILRAKSDDEILFSWNYAMFEDFIGYFIVPSMYEIMANYVKNEITEDDLYAIKSETYDYKPLVEKSIDYYFSIDKEILQNLRQQTYKKIECLLSEAEKKEASAMKLLDETSPIHKLYIYRRRSYERMLDEECIFY